jgi:hypothetical protein
MLSVAGRRGPVVKGSVGNLDKERRGCQPPDLAKEPGGDLPSAEAPGGWGTVAEIIQSGGDNLARRPEKLDSDYFRSKVTAHTSPAPTRSWPLLTLREERCGAGSAALGGEG